MAAIRDAMDFVVRLWGDAQVDTKLPKSRSGKQGN